MAGSTTSIKGFLVDFLTPILQNIGGEPTRKVLIELHRLISGNAASVSLNLGGGRHGHPALTMTSKDYASQTGFLFVMLHNPGDYPHTMVNAQDQALGTENSRKNQGMFRKYTAVDVSFKKKTITAVQPFFLSPLVVQITGFGQVSALTMLPNLFSSYETIDEIDLKGNSIKIMGP